MEASNNADGVSNSLADVASPEQLEEWYQKREYHSRAFESADILDARVIGSNARVTVRLNGWDVTFEKSVADLTEPFVDALQNRDTMSVRFAADDFSKVEVEGDDSDSLPLVFTPDDGGSAVTDDDLSDAMARLDAVREARRKPLDVRFGTVEVDDGQFTAELEVEGTVIPWRVDLRDGLPQELQAVAEHVGGGSIRDIEGGTAYATPRYHRVYARPNVEPQAVVDGPVVKWGLFFEPPTFRDTLARAIQNYPRVTFGLLGSFAVAAFMHMDNVEFGEPRFSPFIVMLVGMGMAVMTIAPEGAPDTGSTYFPADCD